MQFFLFHLGWMEARSYSQQTLYTLRRISSWARNYHFRASTSKTLMPIFGKSNIWNAVLYLHMD
jgi:hypothetical protein